MVVFTGFLLGFLGSLHCIGMCGPLVMAMPAGKGGKLRFTLNKIIYHSGRILTYALLGLLFGLIGDRLRMFAWQQYVSVAMGIVLLVTGIFSLVKTSAFQSVPGFNAFYTILKSWISKFIRKDTLDAQFILGFLNGLLPCGFVYVAIAGAVALGNVWQGIGFMVLFGIGTSPALIGLAWLPRLVNVKKYFSPNKLVPVFSIIFAALFILRGLNLGIPYISPKMTKPMEVKHVQTGTQQKPDEQLKHLEKKHRSCCDD